MTTWRTYTSFEEYVNGTNPIRNDTDGDDWDDGPEVYYQDHDDDGMATGWEYYFNFDPMTMQIEWLTQMVTVTLTTVNISGILTQETSTVSQAVKDNCVIRLRSSKCYNN